MATLSLSQNESAATVVLPLNDDFLSLDVGLGDPRVPAVIAATDGDLATPRYKSAKAISVAEARRS